MNDKTREDVAAVDEYARSFLAELDRRLYVEPSIEPIEDIDYSKLDSGIRDTVRWLRSAGFDTCDSGDGATKQPDPDWGVRPCPHVIIDVHPHELVDECGRLSRLLGSIGIPTLSASLQNPDGPIIQGVYQYAEGMAFIELVNVHDEMLPQELRT